MQIIELHMKLITLAYLSLIDENTGFDESRSISNVNANVFSQPNYRQFRYNHSEHE
jgi:hypothetical protein